MFWSNLFLEEIATGFFGRSSNHACPIFLWIVLMILNIILEQTLLVLAVVYGQSLYSLCICASLKYVIHTMCVGEKVYL